MSSDKEDSNDNDRERDYTTDQANQPANTPNRGKSVGSRSLGEGYVAVTVGAKVLVQVQLLMSKMYTWLP